ncbi:hypothetical protein [Endozoicomonas sp. Mp262]|uniref:RING finger domain-containing protein n=1 Tax=Endozoicomonas sp. Mp262 TaxID=2919499 RepID=UPI0021DAEAC5
MKVLLIGAVLSAQIFPAMANENCAICLAAMHNSKTLECGHKFHPSCIGDWLARNVNCPICRDTDITAMMEEIGKLVHESQNPNLTPEQAQEILDRLKLLQEQLQINMQ